MKCCGICPTGCVLQAKEEARRPKPKPKPSIRSDVQETRVGLWSGELIRRDLRVLWEISCPCHLGGEFPFQVVPSWDAALEIALGHRKEKHP